MPHDKGSPKTKGRGEKSQVLLLMGPLPFLCRGVGGSGKHCGFVGGVGWGVSKLVIQASLHYPIPLYQLLFFSC